MSALFHKHVGNEDMLWQYDGDEGYDAYGYFGEGDDAYEEDYYYMDQGMHHAAWLMCDNHALLSHRLRDV